MHTDRMTTPVDALPFVLVSAAAALMWRGRLAGVVLGAVALIAGLAQARSATAESRTGP